MNINLGIILIMLIITSCIAYFIYIYVYTRPDPKLYVPNNEFVSTDTLLEGDLILFYVTWCPHSQKALKDWDLFKKSYSNPEYSISFSEIDCDAQSKLAEKYKITEYPTIILVKNSLNYEYDANIQTDALNLFINTVMKT